MVYYLGVVLIIFFLSYVLGAISIGLFKVDNKIISFATPIGFFVLLAILYPGYYLITNFQHDALKVTNYFTIYTLVIFAGIVIFGIVRYKDIYKQIKNNLGNYKLLVLALLIAGALFFVFMNITFDYRNDDINHYGIYIPARVFLTNMVSVTYDYQSSFILYSVLLNLLKEIFPAYAQGYLNVGFIYNVIGIIGITVISLGMVDIYNYIKLKFKHKLLAIASFVSVLLVFLSDYWIYSYPHFPGTLKLIVVGILLIMFESLKDNKYLSGLICLLVGGFIGLNSSGFFISAVMLYGYMLYAMINKEEGYLRRLLLFALYPASYAIMYLPVLTKIVVILYVICAGLVYFKIDLKIEEFINKYNIGLVILVLAPLGIITLTYVFNIPSIEQFNAIVTNRNFFDNINGFDMVHEFFRFDRVGLIVFNLLFWIISLLGIILNYKGKNMPVFIYFVTLVTFFNPFVYRFLSMYMTGVAFYRISTVFYNPVMIVALLSVIVDYKEIAYKILTIGTLVLGMTKASLFDTSRIDLSSDNSKIYHANNEELQVIKTLQYMHIDTYEESVKDLEEKRNPFIHDGHVNIASQIYGAQLFMDPNYSIYAEVENLLEDRFAYVVMENSEFEQVFARRIPGYELPEVNFEKACSLAYNKQVDYVIIDAQYNWELQDGLWPCSYQIGEDMGTYRILKMDYNYWEENIKQGYTQIYEVE